MLQVLDSDEEFLIGFRSNIVVIFWGRTTLERIQRIGVAQAKVLEQLKDTGFGSFNVILPRRGTDALPGVQEERDRLLTLCEPYTIAGAIVIEGTGMLATATRATYNAVEKIRPGKFPQKLFGTIDEAASWLVPQCTARTGDTLSVKDLAWDVTAARGVRI